MILEKPSQERAPFRELGIGHAAARRFDAAHDVEHARLHGLPVLDGGAHVAERFRDARLELGELRRVGLAIDLDVHERFEAPFGGGSRRRYGE
jgi:hypothetical protein